MPQSLGSYVHHHPHLHQYHQYHSHVSRWDNVANFNLHWTVRATAYIALMFKVSLEFDHQRDLYRMTMIQFTRLNNKVLSTNDMGTFLLLGGRAKEA